MQEACVFLLEIFQRVSFVLKINIILLQDAVVDAMRRTKMHFVQCVLPQHNAGLCDLRQSMHAPNKTSSSEDIMLNVPLVRQQVRGMELIDAIRIHRQGM